MINTECYRVAYQIGEHVKNAFHDFEWRVAARYEWQDWLDDKSRPVVVPAEGIASLESASAVEEAWKRSQNKGRPFGPVLHGKVGVRTDERVYYPMAREHATLFLEFGELDYRNPTAILAFAQRYGALGLPVKHQLTRIRQKDGSVVDHLAHGEPHLDWALEICLMREGLRLLKGTRSREMSQRLKWLFDRNLQHVKGRLTFDKAGEPKLCLEPLGLIDAMWLQLSLAITGDKRFETCKFCGRMFEISTEQTGFRTHREFCTNACKTKDYRKRRRTALRLANDGADAREISRKTSTEASTVRNWLATEKAKQRLEEDKRV